MPVTEETLAITEDEAEEFIKRFAADPEDVEFLRTDEEWRMFTESKLYFQQNQVMSEGQWSILQKGRMPALRGAGFTVERIFPERPWEVIYRAGKGTPHGGEFISRPDALYRLTTFKRR